MTSKCGKNKKMEHEPFGECVTEGEKNTKNCMFFSREAQKKPDKLCSLQNNTSLCVVILVSKKCAAGNCH